VATRKFVNWRMALGPMCRRDSPDGKRIACLSVPRKGSHRDNSTQDHRSRTQSEIARRLDHHLSSANQTDPTPAFPLPLDSWDGDSHLVYTAERGLRTETIRIDVSTGRYESLPGGRPSARGKFTPAGNAFLKEVALGEQQIMNGRVLMT
jgi:hypothetical protein